MNENGEMALRGVRILELGPYVALPLTGRILASLGAEVIKVETTRCSTRCPSSPPGPRGAGQPDFQRNKKRVSIDVRTPGGLEVFRELVKVRRLHDQLPAQHPRPLGIDFRRCEDSGLT